MKYCNGCHRLTAGDPVFCNHCGGTYNVKLCGSKHVNPRSAEVCSQCGSRDLSTPQPKVPLWARPMVGSVKVIPGLIVMAITIIFFVSLAYAVFINQDLEYLVMKLGLIIVLLWILYLPIAGGVRTVVRKATGRPKKGNRHER